MARRAPTPPETPTRKHTPGRWSGIGLALKASTDLVDSARLPLPHHLFQTLCGRGIQEDHHPVDGARGMRVQARPEFLGN